MPLSDKHPGYIARLPDWLLMRDSWEGERIVKFKRTTYLPATRMQEADGMTNKTDKGSIDYEAYLARAVYHEIIKPSVEAMLGVMHSSPPTIELPPQLDDMRDKATFNGESLETLLVRINEQQLLMGRLGCLLDVATGAKASEMPYVVLYNAETINNWDTSRVYDDNGLRKLQFVVLNETAIKRNAQLSWVSEIRYRVLADAEAMQDAWPGLTSQVAGANYVVGEADKAEILAAAQFITPQLAGRGLERIPFVFVGPRDLVPDPDMPPFLGLARLALAIYRGEADYRQAVHLQSQGTLVFMGLTKAAEDEIRVGAGHSICLPLQGDAKYVGAGHECLDPMLESIKEDETRAARLGASLLDQKGGTAESGDALTIRTAARTCTLNTIADAGGYALECLLRDAAIWVGADPDKVAVQPNKEFADSMAVAQDINFLMQAKALGAPISSRSIHGWLVDNDFTVMTFDDEMEEIQSEPPPVGLLGGTPGLAGVPGPKTLVDKTGKPVLDPKTGKPMTAGAKPAAKPPAK